MKVSGNQVVTAIAGRLAPEYDSRQAGDIVRTATRNAGTPVAFSAEGGGTQALTFSGTDYQIERS